MKKRRHHESLGDAISTLVFFGLALYALLAGFEYQSESRFTEMVLVWLAGAMCFAGSLRFTIARFADQIETWRK